MSARHAHTGATSVAPVARLRDVLTDRTFWRDLGTLAGLVITGVALAAGIWLYVWGFAL